MVSIKDISKKTGFSVTTVSRALNNHSDVSEATKMLIQAKAKDMNYVPNLLAKQLVNQSTKTIGFITNRFVKGSLMDNFSIRVFLGMFDASSEYEVILIHYDEKVYSSKRFDTLVKERQLEGVVALGFDENAPFVQEVLSSSCPSILIDIGFENETTSYVGSDISQAFSLAMSLMEENEYQDIMIVVGSDMSYITTKWVEEINNYMAKQSNLSIRVINGNYTEEDAKAAIKHALTVESHPQAIFCLSDLMAIGVCVGLKELNINIPDEISVLGYDDIVISSYLTPSLSSIAQKLEKIGEFAVKNLIELISGRKVLPQIISVELQLRESFKLKENE